MIWGIDFGARLSGNTALASFDGSKVVLKQSLKKKDSTEWLRTNYLEDKPLLIGIDAPLSLPSGFYNSSGDLHYRQADRELGAMSPMFIGGLTARAIEWTRSLQTRCIEVYPSGIADLISDNGRKLRKKEPLSFFNDSFINYWNATFKQAYSGPAPENIHQLDALLALLVAIKHERGISRAFGDEREGLIWI